MMIANQRDRAANEQPCSREESAAVRIATVKDAEGKAELLKIDIRENAEVVAPSNDEDIRATIRQALAKPSITGVIDWTGRETDRLRVMLLALKWWWSRSFYYQELPLFVHPEHCKTHRR